MRAALSGGSDQLLIRSDVQIGEPRSHELLVKVSHCGVCHSDLSVHDLMVAAPSHVVLGHEAAGEVAAVGSDVTDFAPGDRVLLTPIGSCGNCYWCQRGQPSLCSECDQLTAGTRPDGTSPLTVDGVLVQRGLGVGGFGEYTVVPQRSAVRLTDDTPLDIACVIGCSIQTGVGAVFNVAHVEEGATVLVTGFGGIGAAVVQGCRIAGASQIIVSDPVASRRDAAIHFGATLTVDPLADDPVAFVAAHTDGVGADYAFEAAGVAQVLDTCIQASRIGGTTVVLGADASMTMVEVMPLQLATHGKRIVGSLLGDCLPARDIPRFVEWWRRGELDLESMISHRFALDQINEAFTKLRDADGIRSVVEMGPAAS